MRNILLAACILTVLRSSSQTLIDNPHKKIIESFSAAVISVPPAALKLDTFYKKYTDAFGIPVVSSNKVPDDALLVARDIINYMLLKRTDIRAALIK